MDRKETKKEDTGAPEKVLNGNLSRAAEAGELYRIREIGQKSADVSAHAFTLALAGAAAGRIDVLKLAREWGPDLHLASVFFRAALKGRISALEFLVEWAVEEQDGRATLIHMVGSIADAIAIENRVDVLEWACSEEARCGWWKLNFQELAEKALLRGSLEVLLACKRRGATISRDFVNDTRRDENKLAKELGEEAGVRRGRVLDFLTGVWSPEQWYAFLPVSVPELGALASLIDPALVLKREGEQHVTVHVEFSEPPSSELVRTLTASDGKRTGVELEITRLGVLEKGDADFLVAFVQPNEKICALHTLLGEEFKVKWKHDSYWPHITIATLHKGTAAGLLKVLRLAPRTVVADRICFRKFGDKESTLSYDLP